MKREAEKIKRANIQCRSCVWLHLPEFGGIIPNYCDVDGGSHWTYRKRANGEYSGKCHKYEVNSAETKERHRSRFCFSS